MNANKIFETCCARRQCGSTTWILDSAVLFPKCILVFWNMKYAREMECRYNEIVKDLIKRGIIPIDLHRDRPIFTSVESNLNGMERMPIIFDNSCFF